MVAYTSMTEQTCCSCMLIHHWSVTFSIIYVNPCMVHGFTLGGRLCLLQGLTHALRCCSWPITSTDQLWSSGLPTQLQCAVNQFPYSLMNLILFKGLYDQALVPVYCMQRDQSSTILLDNNKWMNIWLKAQFDLENINVIVKY